MNSTDRVKKWRAAQKAAGLTELRGLYATSKEQAVIKKLAREKLAELRGNV